MIIRVKDFIVPKNPVIDVNKLSDNLDISYRDYIKLIYNNKNCFPLNWLDPHYAKRIYNGLIEIDNPIKDLKLPKTTGMIDLKKLKITTGLSLKTLIVLFLNQPGYYTKPSEIKLDISDNAKDLKTFNALVRNILKLKRFEFKKQKLYNELHKTVMHKYVKFLETL